MTEQRRISRRKLRIVRSTGMGALLGALLVGQLWALPPLHEFFQPDPAEDLRLGATTPSGRSPAVLDTPSGLVSAPSGLDGPRRQGSVYGGNHTQLSADAAYHLDRLTSAPSRVEYDEPFRPSVLPFKRSYAFDEVREDFSLGVRDVAMTHLEVSGPARPGEDVFFADLEVDLLQGQAVRIPSVGPGARVLSVESAPAIRLELFRDGAENWFVRAAISGRVRLLMQLGWPARVLDAGFAQVPAAQLALAAGRLPVSVQLAALEVQKGLGLAPGDPYAQLTRLIEHFRGFTASDELPQAKTAAELYVEIALSKKGVCRHRAFAFLVTALSLGIPARLVHNEAHAWVEVGDGNRFYRVDLGGAPAELAATRPVDNVPIHRPPVDPFAWPSDAHSGAQLAARSSAQAPGSWPSALSSGSGPAPGGNPQAGGAGPSASDRIELELSAGELRRGSLLSLRGRASRDGRACAVTRVDIGLSNGGGTRPLGSLASDEQGRFAGQVLLPLDVPVGPQAVVARLGAGCPRR